MVTEHGSTITVRSKLSSMIKATVFMELLGTHVAISTLSSAENSPAMEPDNHVDAN